MQVGRIGGAVEHEVALRGGRGEVEEVLADPLVEIVAFGLDAVVDVDPRRARPTAAGTSRTIVRSGNKPGDRPDQQLVDLLGPQIAAGTLIGDRGVGVAVGDDIDAAFEGRADELVDMVSLVGGIQQGLGARRDVPAVQDEVADRAAQGGASGLASDDDRRGPRR
jgi:hypothetical protein